MLNKVVDLIEVKLLDLVQIPYGLWRTDSCKHWTRRLASIWPMPEEFHISLAQLDATFVPTVATSLGISQEDADICVDILKHWNLNLHIALEEARDTNALNHYHLWWIY